VSIMRTRFGDDERRVAPSLKPVTITVSTACALSGLGATKIWQLIRDGRLPATRVGNRTLIHYASFEALLLDPAARAARKRMPTPPQVKAKTAKGARQPLAATEPAT
jgi:excisionase family DNA binding protein